MLAARLRWQCLPPALPGRSTPRGTHPGCARCTHSPSPQALGPCRELFASGIFLNIFEVFKSARFSRLSLELLNLSSWTESGQKIGPCHRSLVTVVGVGSWVSGVLIFSAHRSPRTPGPHCSEPALLRPAPQHHSLSPPPIPVSASPRPASFPACGHLASLQVQGSMCAS